MVFVEWIIHKGSYTDNQTQDQKITPNSVREKKLKIFCCVLNKFKNNTIKVGWLYVQDGCCKENYIQGIISREKEEGKNKEKNYKKNSIKKKVEHK